LLPTSDSTRPQHHLGGAKTPLVEVVEGPRAGGGLKADLQRIAMNETARTPALLTACPDSGKRV
jgi:hypothetical protein